MIAKDNVSDRPVGIKQSRLILKIRVFCGEPFELHLQVEAVLVERSVIEPDWPLMSLLDRVAQDAVERCKPGASAREQKWLIDCAHGVEAVACRALDTDLFTGCCGISKPGTHLAIGDFAHVKLERSFCRQAGNRVAAGEAVFSKKR